MGEPIDLTHRFEPAERDAWRAQVRRDLDGREPESLRWRSPDGVEVEPLYVPPDRPPERGTPGAPPFVRGSEAERQWQVVHEAVGTDADAVLASAARALEEGADALWIGPEAFSLLPGVDALAGLGAPTWVEPGAGAAEVAARWLEGETRHLTVVSDPLRSGGGYTALVGVLEKAPPSARPVLVSARAYHEAGASAVDELAIAIASGVAYLRGLSEAGAHLAELPRRMLFELALDSDFFVGVAKLRAARLLWSKVLRTMGVDGAEQGMRIRATSSRRATSAIDPQLNVLRGTASAFAAVLGGAELVSVAPYDALSGTPSAHAERLARNTQLLMREESQLGRVLDPAGGSYFLEELTDSLARSAWVELGMIEHLGGMERGLADGSIAERVAKGAEVRRRAVATRERGVVGVSRYPSPEAPAVVPEPAAGPLAPMRDAEPFERIRLAAAALPDERRRALVLGVGDARALKPRMDFARDVLEVAGLAVTMLEARASTDHALAALPERAPAEVNPCASDDDTLAVLRALAPRLRERGAEQIVAATKPSDILREAGAARFVHRGADLASVLGELVAALEVA